MSSWFTKKIRIIKTFTCTTKLVSTTVKVELQMFGKSFEEFRELQSDIHMMDQNVNW